MEKLNWLTEIKHLFNSLCRSLSSSRVETRVANYFDFGLLKLYLYFFIYSYFLSVKNHALFYGKKKQYKSIKKM